jgi:hypothetical protein
MAGAYGLCALIFLLFVHLWLEHTGQATFVLNANVSFLSIQSVDQGGNLVLNRSPAQIASYLSILTSIGSIILGLLLLKQTRNRDRDTPTAAVGFHALLYAACG